MELRVLGPLSAVRDGETIPLGGPKQQTVLALLVAAAGRPVSLDSLIDGVYGDDAAGGTRRTVQTYVSNLRGLLGEVIERVGPGYILHHDQIDLDATRFQDDVAAAESLMDTEPAESARLLGEALELWRGHPYAGIDAYGGLAETIAHLEEARLGAVEMRIEADLNLGRHAQVVGELDALTTQHPYREQFRAQHMLALYRSGRQAEALRSFAAAHDTLQTELGIDPTHDLQDLELAILNQDPDLDPPLGRSIERRAILVAELDDQDGSAPLALHEPSLVARDERFNSTVSELGGVVLGVSGMAAYAAFADAESATAAARSLAGEDLRLAVDQGDVEVTTQQVTGPPVSRALRLAAVAHPGQVLLSPSAHAALTGGGSHGWSALSLGRHEIRGFDEPLTVFQLTGVDLRTEYPTLLLHRIPPPTPTVRAGGTLLGYELRTEIAADGAGAVFDAYQASVGRQVTVRVLRREFVSDPGFIRRFEAHAGRIASTIHPHLVPLIDYWRAPDGACLVWGLADSSGLDVTADVPDQEWALDVVTKVGSAIARGHASGVMHGMLRPDYIRLLDGHPYVIDLGLAGMVHDITPLSVDAYTAMETINAGPSMAGDVYALGVLAAELFSGRSAPPDGELPSAGPEIDRIIQRATLPDPDRRYQSVEDLVADLVAVATSTPSPVSQRRGQATNPYRGLSAFAESDADVFFGRSDVTTSLLTAIGRHQMVMVVGPSGVGKSSIVRAGVVPGLRNGLIAGSESWLITDMVPGARPFDALERALSRIAKVDPGVIVDAVRSGATTLCDAVKEVAPTDAPLVLIIDQFEELFTQVADDKTRRQFLKALTAAAGDPGGGVRLILTMRADYFDRPLLYGDFGELLENAIVPVSTPTAAELSEIVRGPAMTADVEMEDALVAAVVGDADNQPGALPLLQHALTELFQHRRTDLITLDEYQEAGGLSGSVGRRAEAIYTALADEDQETARDIFLNLVTVDEQTDDTRRRVREDELFDLGLRRESVNRVVEAFGRRRLVVFDRDPVTRTPTVEVAHEALIRNWARFQAWIDGRRADLLTRRRLELAAADWIKAGRDPSFHLRGGRLERAEMWRDNAGMAPTADQLAFLESSRAAHDAETLRRRRNRRRVIGGLSAAALIASVFGVVALVQRNIAQRQTTETQVHDLASSAFLAMEEDPNLAINLALEAYDRSLNLPGQTPGEVMAALQTTAQDSRLVAILADGEQAAISPTGSVFALRDIDDPQRVVLYDANKLERIRDVATGAEVGPMAFSGDGLRLFVSRAEPTEGADQAAAFVYDVETLDRVGVLEAPCCIDDLEVSPDGELVAAGIISESGILTVTWSADTLDEKWTSDPTHRIEEESSTGWLPDGSMAICCENQPYDLIRLDRETGERIDRLRIGGTSINATTNPVTGDTTVVYTAESVARTFGFGAAEALDEISTGGAQIAYHSPDGSKAALIGNSDVVEVIETEGGRLSLRGIPGGSPLAEFYPDGSRVVTTSIAGPTYVWDVTPAGPSPGSVYADGDVNAITVSNDSAEMTLTVGRGETGMAVRYDLRDGSNLYSAGPFRWEFLGWPALSTQGDIVGAYSPDRSGASLVSIENGNVVYEVAGCGLPVAIDGDGTWTVVGGDGGDCQPSGAEDSTLAGYLANTASDDRVVEWPQLPMAAGFGPSGTPSEGLVAVNHGQEELEIRRLPTGQLIDREVFDAIFRPTFSPDGKWLVFPSQAEGARVLDMESIAAGSPIAESIALVALVHGGPTQTAATAGELLATTHSGQSVRVWSISTGEEWFNLPVKTGNFTAVTFSSDARYLHYEDSGGTVRRMPLDPAELAELASTRTFRDFNVDECERYLPDDVDCAVYATE